MRFFKRLIETGGLVGAVLALLALAPGPVRGQFAQYTQPGTVARGGTEVTRDGMETALSEARWNLGAIRIEPWIGLRNVSWSENPSARPDAASGAAADTEGDLSASGGAGLRAYLPTGHSVFWAAHVLPEYTWWRDQDERSRLNGRYGLGMFAFFNRLTLQLTGQRQDQQSVVSAEVPAEVNNRRDELALAAETRLGFATSFFAEVSATRTRNSLEDEDALIGTSLRSLDRDENSVRTGLRYRPRERFTLGVGYEWTETDSQDPAEGAGGRARDLSNTGTAPIVELRYTGPTFWASGSAAFRSIEAEGGSELRDTDTETYALGLGLTGNRLSPAVYARKTLSLALSEEYSHFTNESVGASLGLGLGRRVRLRAYGEVGEAEFRPRLDGTPVRTDDLTAYGAELTFNLGRGLNAHVGGSRTEFDSNLPGEDRTLDVVRAGITLGLGGGESGWV